jgi:hypothetical protein
MVCAAHFYSTLLATVPMTSEAEAKLAFCQKLMWTGRLGTKHRANKEGYNTWFYHSHFILTK